MHTGTFLASLILLGSATFGSFAPAGDEFLKAKDHKKLGKKVSSYWVAKDEKKAISASFQKLSEEIDKVAKSLTKKKGPDVLAAIDDWEQVFWFATAEGLNDKKLKKGKITTASPEGYAEFTYLVGKKYATKKGPVPMILVIPDVGMSPSDALEASWEDAAMRDEAILIVVHMTGDGSDWGTDVGATQVMTTYGSVVRGLTSFGFDCDRVFLAGMGKGFAAAASTASSFPHLFAGLIGRGDIPEVSARNFLNTPTYLTGGGATEKIAAAIDALGFGNCKADGADTSADAWAWTKENPRIPYPERISFAPASRRAVSANWLTLNGVDEETAEVDALIDRDSNTITITTVGISQITLMLNDSMLDLDAPVNVILNGTEHEALLQRNSRRMIDQVYNLGDWGRVFTATQGYDAAVK